MTIWGVEGRHLWVPPDAALLSLDSILAQVAAAPGIAPPFIQTNLATNPKATVDTAGWAASGAALTRTATGALPGFATEFQLAGAAGYGADTIAVTNGRRYHFSASVGANTLAASGIAIRLEVRDAGGTLKASSISIGRGGGPSLPDGAEAAPGITTGRLDVGVTADSTGDWTFRVVVTVYTTDGAFTPWAQFSGVLIQEARGLRDFFDGDTAGATWTGTANASTSTMPLTAGAWLNRRSDDLGVDVFPLFKVEHISGLMGGGESGDRRDNKVGGQGEIPRRSFRRGKTITYEGLTQATTRAGLRQAEASLNASLDDQMGEGLMIVTPHPLYDGSGAYRYFSARAITCEIDDEITFSPNRPKTRGHESPFVIALRHARANGVGYFDQDDVAYP